MSSLLAAVRLRKSPRARPSLAARAASGHAAAAPPSRMNSRRFMSAPASCHRLVGLPHLQPATGGDSGPIAFFIPRRLAVCIAQALSQDHFFDRSML